MSQVKDGSIEAELPQEPVTWQRLKGRTDGSFLAESFLAGQVAGLIAAADPGPVLDMLYEKIQGLRAVSATLLTLINTTSDVNLRLQTIATRAAAVDEITFCEARYYAINGGGPFGAGSPGAEDALLSALRKVARATANTAALAALLDAVNGLVAAFPSKFSNV